MMTGNWGKKKGVAQMYPRLTFLQSLSFLRRVDAPSSDASTSKLTGPRHYHPSQVGFLCLTGDTEILMSDGSVKLIKDVVNGDSVKTYDYQSGNLIDTQVKNWFSQSCDKLIKVTFTNGKQIKCTPDHEFLVKFNNGFEDVYEMKVVNNIQENEYLIEVNNGIINYVKIIDVVEITPELVYDFETVENTHNFVANSLVISNCCVESPEHSNIGLVKHLSLLGSITVGSHSQANIIYNMLIENVNFIHLNNHSAINLATITKVFLNGEWIGMTDKPDLLYKELRILKQNGVILRTNGIIHDMTRGEIKVYTESGRLFRPIINVKDNKVVLTDTMINEIITDPKLKGLNKFDALITKYPDAIDYIDMEEQYYALVAESKDKVLEMKKRETGVFPDKNEPIINRYDSSMILRYTHSEFHPSMIIGIIAGNIPFANHNQGPRNIFQYANQNQSELLIQ
jgi:DNA-directed RNA polymerase beta subunit